MHNETVALIAATDTRLNDSLESSSIKTTSHEPFLTFDPTQSWPFSYLSRMFRSLIALVKAQYPLDNALQDKAVRLLKRIDPNWNQHASARLVTELVPSPGCSPSGFIESITTLLSSPYSTVVSAAFSLLRPTIVSSPLIVRRDLVESDIIPKVLATIHPHTLPISGNEKKFDDLVTIITQGIKCALPSDLWTLNIKTAGDRLNLRKMIFQKVVQPSSRFVMFLITNRSVLSGDLLFSFVYLLCKLLHISPFHPPTLEFVFSTPIVTALSNSLAFSESNPRNVSYLIIIEQSLKEWQYEDSKVAKSGKRVTQAQFSEGFEDHLEQLLIHHKGDSGLDVGVKSVSISQLLGSNVKRW
ncbi:hypothetical protein BLNAU_22537 [Blattamonas nauphoetae]|uniref:Uncharacterized protein n=1 Tax=Blattamonas nauphoetae TaxID=2049346 RepID=A0ABQ9WX02_9EUKA|nr:hypothetical protein BLNAU_22537 [Blattamonas nauphoetae]